MNQICRKNNLANNLRLLERVFEEEYDFSPRTWTLPYDRTDLKQYIGEKRVLSMIVKPVASCQGRGIFITKRLDEVLNGPDEQVVVQKYL